MSPITSPLILWGGVDINPSLYNEERNPRTQIPNDKRDEEELRDIDYAIEDDRPIIGVCRGAQLLNVYNGGSLYQHVELKPMATVDITCSDGNIRKAMVDHHQVMIPPTRGAIPLAWQILDKPVKAYQETDKPELIKIIPQVIYFPEIKGLAIQPHPEWMQQSDPFVKWINQLCFNLLGVTEPCF